MLVIAKDYLAKFLDLERMLLDLLELRLYVDVDVTLDANTVAADFMECTDGGYVATSVSGWGTPFVNGDDDGETDGVTLTFTFLRDVGDFTVFGYYLTDPGNSDAFVFGERDPAPFNVTAPGQTYTVGLRKVMRSTPP